MRKLNIVVLLLLGTFAIVAWKAAPATGGHVSALATTGNSSVSGNYAVSFDFHDRQVDQQDGAGAGTLFFDGKGGLRGVISEINRCSGPECGDSYVVRASVLGTYTVFADGSASLDLCLTITDPTPGNVEVHWEGAFSTFFLHFRFIQTLLFPTCGSLTFVQSPNVTTGTADKV